VNSQFSSSLFASGTNAPQVGLLTTLSGSGAIQIQVTSSAVTQLTLSLTIPAISAFASTSALASSGFGLHLLAPSTEFAANGQTGATFYGAVALSISGNVYTYTIPINTANAVQNLYLTGLDALQALSASTSASVGASASTNANGGSAVFNANANANAAAKLFPITYNTAFPVVANVQYSYGKNIQVAPLVNGTTLSVALNNNFAANGAASGSGSSAISAPPATSNGGYFNGNYQFSGSSNANNVIQWSADSNAQFTSSAGATYTAAQASAAAQFANAASWYKSTQAAGSATTSASWSQVSSYRSNVNGKVTVWAQVQSYSQWTVAASTNNSTATQNGSSTTGSASNVQICVAAVFAALALVFAF